MRITDNAITVIADDCAELIELCIRNCLLVTNKAMKALAKRGRLQHEFILLRKLDICNCPRICLESVKYLKKPYFRGLQWIGIGQTHSILVADTVLPQICRERPWLTICKDGCEIPSIPNMPQPQIPTIPNMPQPQMPTIPTLPNMPTIPNMPKVSLPPLPSMPTIPNLPTTIPQIPFFAPPPSKK
ncbi:F-box domain, cyclin-like protein [Tanacetum coccineum]|uniref:F-box domain, cyclin-like protein n=1 Tax=Tanacetum coccineum TaxID=301880 RepID=A0ABQ5BHD1_9ASTR